MDTDKQQQRDAHSYANLSTKVTVIVFWGLIIVGLVFAALLLQNRGEVLRAQRTVIADALAYKVDQWLLADSLATSGNRFRVREQLSSQLDHYPDVGLEIQFDGLEPLRVGAEQVEQPRERIERVIDVRSDTGSGRRGLLIISFPELDSVLHAERSRLLLILGTLLLVFGVALKGLLERVLTLPMARMVRTAQHISEGRDTSGFDVLRNDEFGYLGRFINQALERIRASESEARRAKELAEVTLYSIGDAVVTTNHNGRVVYMNPVAERLLQISLDDAQGQFLPDIMPLVEEDTGVVLEHPILDCLRNNRTVELDADCALKLRSGTLLPVADSAAPIRDNDGNLRGAVMVFHDVSVARNLQRELTYQASHDPLTGLYNRREFDRELQRVLDRAGRDQHVHTLCYLDLDQFKIVNDTCGHAAGDQLLQKLTAHLQVKLRKADVLARLGGDEFGLLLMHCTIQRAMEVSETLRQVINEFRFSWHGKSFQIGVSIGLVEMNSTLGSSAEALAAADMACYAAKEDGRNRVHVYRPDDQELLQRREQMGMVAAVQRALAEDHLELHAQIIVPVSESITVPHYEILVRMRDPDGNLVSPGAFIPAAERFQLMSSLDRWVVQHSLHFAAHRARIGQPVELSINLSGQSLSEDQFLDYVIEHISRSGVLPEYLCFEITETAAINNMARAVRFMTAIRKLGCHFALDDFGSGMSSFGYLKNLPVDFLKIDGSFVRNIDVNPVDQAMVKAVQDVARLMNMRTVAEFVENQASLDTLKSIGIDRAQGYFLGRPMPLIELFPDTVQIDDTAPRLKLVKT